MDDKDIQFMKRAIELSMKCKPEPGKATPKVGAVVAKNGQVLAEAWRGEKEPGEHAEFTVLEKTLSECVVAGATLYTTLEPCTTRNHPKIPRAHRIIERKVDRVFIGMLDPNPNICGKGVRLLRDHNLKTVLFPNELAAEVEDLNRDFRRQIEAQFALHEVDEDFVQTCRQRDIDEWYNAINYIYADSNFYRDSSSLFAHLVEVVGGLSQLASAKEKPGPLPEAFLPKALAWWFSLCGKLGVISVGDLIWLKFPGVCPYCLQELHDSTLCTNKKKQSPIPEWETLRGIGQRKKRPKSLGEWQRMFRNIYKLYYRAEFESTFARLAEELGELAEAIRVFPAAPGYVLSEAADVFAWLMNIQNNIDFRDGKQQEDYGNKLEEGFCRAYPDYCIDCSSQRCVCPPILQSTIGRIGHEFSVGEEMFDSLRIFVPAGRANKAFRSER